MNAEARTEAQLKEHYEIEKELASRLRNASPQLRPRLYAEVYNELFKRIPHHPQLLAKRSKAAKRTETAAQVAILTRYVTAETRFVEIGAGDCALSIEMSERVSQVIALDVSFEITHGLNHPDTLQVALFDGLTLPLRPSSVDVAYSHQLIEHLHPDDAHRQLESIYDALDPGGRYVCITKSRLSGPHDISGHFDRVATGFHLKEYTVFDLATLFREIGFTGIAVHYGARASSPSLPAFFPILCERLLCRLPSALRKGLVRRFPFRPLLEYIILVATKPAHRPI